MKSKGTEDQSDGNESRNSNHKTLIVQMNHEKKHKSKREHHHSEANEDTTAETKHKLIKYKVHKRKLSQLSVHSFLEKFKHFYCLSSIPLFM